MVFKLSRTFNKPAQGANAQRGFPSPGAGDQTVGDYDPQPSPIPWTPERPIKGIRSFFAPARPANAQRGFPDPQNGAQARPQGSMPNVPPVYGGPMPVWTPYFSRGAAAYVQNYGKVLTNPIGAGIVALNRPQASYGPAASYVNGSIWWTSQAIPTSVNLQGLTSPEALAAVLGPTNVQAAIRVG